MMRVSLVAAMDCHAIEAVEVQAAHSEAGVDSRHGKLAVAAQVIHLWNLGDTQLDVVGGEPEQQQGRQAVAVRERASHCLLAQMMRLAWALLFVLQG